MLKRILALGVVGVCVFLAAKGFGERAGSIAVLQPAESGVMQSAFGSRVQGIGGPVYAVAEEQIGVTAQKRVVRRPKGVPAGHPIAAARHQPLAGARHLYLGTRRGVYASGDEGVTWERIFSPGIFGGAVRAIAPSPQPSPRGRGGVGFLYIGAGKALYRFDPQNKRAERILRTKSPILSVAVDPIEPGRVLIGTGRGLHANPGLPEGPVYVICFHPNRPREAYAVTDAGLFISGDRGGAWRRVWVGRQMEPEEGSPFDELRANGSVSEVLSDEEGPVRPRALAIDPEAGVFYLADERKIFVSTDEGKSWVRLSCDLPPGEIHAMALAKNGDSPHSGTVPIGGRHLWVGTDEGLFRVPLPAPAPLLVPPQPGLLPSGEKGIEGEKEPTIREVHQVVIRYAEVMPGKISGWRAGAMWRNFFPRFTLGLDRDRERTIASSTSGGKTTFTLGPEDESVSLDFGFTWDLANLVWNPDQTSIDTRSRLMVQLRQDILEEVTRVYFERRRLRAEFEANPTDDAVLQAERELRIAELTAKLDAYTGGWFSNKMEG